MPPSPEEWLASDHLVYFLLDVGEVLDLRAIEARYQSKDSRGTRPYDPRMMVLLLLYAYCVGRPSSRRIERATYEDVGFRVLTGGQHPDHTRISEFRRENLAELRGLFLQVLRLCQEAGLVKLGHVALDGTKMGANASKHKAMSYERMKKVEAELAAEVDELLKKAETADADEDERYGPSRRGDELPDELQRRESRLAKLRAAKKKLEAEAAAAKARERRERANEAQRDAEAASPEEEPKAERRADRAEEDAAEAAERARRRAREADEPEPDLAPRRADEFPSHQVQANRDGEPAPKAQRNFTDAESRIMKTGNGYLQGYNAQVAADGHAQVIVAEHVTNQAPDVQHLAPMLGELEGNCGTLPEVLSADNGYWSEANVKVCADKGVDAYIATGRLKHGEKPPALRGRVPKNLDAKGRMARKLRTKKGRATYAKRKAIVEPVFGQMKGARGLRGFLLRGLAKVQGEFTLMCTTHNLLKLYRASLAPA